VIGARVRASHVGSYRTYGARRVWHDLLAEGISCGLHRVKRLLQAQGLRARPRRRGLPKDQGERLVIAGNVLDRQFTAGRPNQKWVADFTYIWTAEGWLYVAAVIDLFSRRVVGWSMSDTMTTQLVTNALIMAIWRRGKPDALLHHSNQNARLGAENTTRSGRTVRSETKCRSDFIFRSATPASPPSDEAGIYQPSRSKVGACPDLRD
jgi:putative transposase